MKTVLLLAIMSNSVDFNDAIDYSNSLYSFNDDYEVVATQFSEEEEEDSREIWGHWVRMNTNLKSDYFLPKDGFPECVNIGLTLPGYLDAKGNDITLQVPGVIKGTADSDWNFGMIEAIPMYKEET